MSCLVLSHLLSPPLPAPWTAVLQTWFEITSSFPAKEQRDWLSRFVCILMARCRPKPAPSLVHFLFSCVSYLSGSSVGETEGKRGRGCRPLPHDCSLAPPSSSSGQWSIKLIGGLA